MIRVLSMLLLAASAPSGCGDDDGEVADVLMCMGSCTCDEDTRTCTCAGGTACMLDGASDVTLQCDGNASCDLDCGESCDVICPGTSGCTSTIGDESTGHCQGTGMCEFTCTADCAVECGGTSTCLVHCADGARCDLTECRMQEDCGEGLFACGRACP